MQNSSILPADLPITIDPEIHSGTPVFRGTRVPIEVLFGNLADGYSLDDILDNYPSIKREDAIKLLKAAPQSLTGVLQLEDSVR